jgi:hypothetical protein
MTRGAWGSLFRFATICPEVVERPFDRLTVLPSAMSSLRSELRVEDGPNGATSKDTIILHIMKQPHEQCLHSDGHSLCLSAGIVAGLSTECCPLWGRLQAWASFGWRN